MGINLGARIGPLVTGWLQESSGFHWGFGAAAIGMALGLGIYALGRNKLPEETHRVPNPLPSAQRSRYGLIFLGIAVVIAVFHTQMVALFFLSVSLGTRWPASWPDSTTRPTSCPISWASVARL